MTGNSALQGWEEENCEDELSKENFGARMSRANVREVELE